MAPRAVLSLALSAGLVRVVPAGTPSNQAPLKQLTALIVPFGQVVDGWEAAPVSTGTLKSACRTLATTLKKDHWPRPAQTAVKKLESDLVAVGKAGP